MWYIQVGLLTIVRPIQLEGSSMRLCVCEKSSNDSFLTVAPPFYRTMRHYISKQEKC
jgi:hypothetical protein